MPPIRVICEILVSLSTTPDLIEAAIHEVITPITRVLIDNPHWTSYGMFLFGLI
jgi:hypothetical protein